jgi:hypothetical protein
MFGTLELEAGTSGFSSAAFRLVVPLPKPWHRWSPLVCQAFIDDGKKVEIAAIDPDFESRQQPLSLMEYAGRFLNRTSSSRLPVKVRFACHGLTCLAITS